MLVISLKRFIVSFLLIILTTGIIIYISITSQSGESLQLRIDTQNIFFWGIIAFLVQIWVGLSLIFSHKHMVNNLKKISKIGDISHKHAQRILSKMGSLGSEIETMMIEQNKLVVLRSNRISALNTLVKILCDGYTDPVIITDVRGSILSISNEFTEKIKKEGNDISWKQLGDVRPDINLPDVLSHLEKQHLPWSDPEVKGVVCTPVFDKVNMLNFCIWEFETQHINKIYKEKQNVITQKKTFGKAQDLLKRFTGRKK
jgi:hypothetical protein